MSLIAKAAGGSSVPPMPEGSYAAVCVRIVDIGLQHKKFKDKERDVHEVVLTWEVPGETVVVGEDVVPRTLSSTYTLSLHERSKLRKDLESWRGRRFTDEELAGFDLRNILGAPCLLQIVHNRTETGVYANIASIMSMPRGMSVQRPETALMAFDIDEADNEDLNELPAWLQDKVRQSLDWQNRGALAAANAAEGEGQQQFAELDSEDDLPF